MVLLGALNLELVPSSTTRSGGIRDQGRMAWQKATGYGRRSLAETGIGRYKAAIGPQLRARTLAGQQGEAAIAVEVLNRMIRTAKPISVRVA